MATPPRRRRRQQLPRMPRTTRPAPATGSADGATAPADAAPPGEPTGTPGPGDAGPVPERLLLDVAVRVWLARQHAARAATPSRPLTRELDQALDALAGAGVVVQGHDGSGFDPGLSLVVVAYQPLPGITREQVVETVRPSVYLRGRQVRRGEVVVGVPQPAEPPRPPEDQPDPDASGAAR